jgi:geranylgeranyl reductase family protein
MDSVMSGKLHDVIVIGAGPSGTTAARQCALNGLDTLLIEKKEFPRYKPCAGAVTQWALSTLDFEIPQDIVERDLFGGRFFFKENSAEAHKPFRIGILTSRPTFDDFLLSKAKEAGAKTLLGTEAKDYHVSTDHVEVLTDKGSIRGQCLVIAEGAIGGLARRIRDPFGPREAGMTVVTEIESSEEEIERRTQGKILVYFDVAHRGYGWIFPHDTFYSVGVGGLRGRIGNSIGLMRDFLTKHGFDGRQKFRSHFLPIGGIRRTVADHRIILVGDAAGFVDAFVGEGIGYAILSGKLAAETIEEALGHGSNARVDLTPFQQRCDERFGARLRYAFYLHKVLHSLPGLFLRILASRDEVIDNLLNVSVWKMTYREFLIWFLSQTPRYLL